MVKELTEMEYRNIFSAEGLSSFSMEMGNIKL